MKYMIYVLLWVLATSLSAQSVNKPFQFPAKLKEMKDMIKVPAGTFTMGRHSEFIPRKKDSCLLASYTPLRYTVMDFYISNHEVTNNEYRQFVTWVQDSIKKKNVNTAVTPSNTLYEFFDDKRVKHILNIYPDTARWTTEFPYYYQEPMVAYYYQHPAYADYPVVGISYEQAVAYCYWKMNLINQQMPKNSIVIIRLPNEAEWEYAALYRTPPKDEKDYVQEIYLYPWKSFSLQDAKGNYYANFGNIIDVNDLMIKSYMDDNAVYPATVKSYVANEIGLFNMAGNVAEWVQDVPDIFMYTDSLGNKINITYRDDLNTIVDKLRSVSFLAKMDGKRLEDLAGLYMHDVEILHRISGPRLVKGGSWADAPIYIQPGSKEVRSKNSTSCRVGFRIAMDVHVFDSKDGL